MQLRTITVTVFHNIMSLPVIVLIEMLSPFLFHYFSKAKLYYQRYFFKNKFIMLFFSLEYVLNVLSYELGETGNITNVLS